MLRGRMYDGIEQGRFRSNIYVQEDDFGILNALWKIFGFCSEEVYKKRCHLFEAGVVTAETIFLLQLIMWKST
ncbi:hypothetical protein V527_20175 [Pseudomonas aeruginosa VRFPA06]|nr:hypothetical protein V527_20175 [Pseudomonas aeruginosa VRFPA06]